jgi:predicted ATPase
MELTKVSRINNLKIEGFRRINKIDLNLQERPFIVIIGANGVGKTSFLDAISLLSASAAGTLNSTLNDMGGISEIRTRERSEPVSLEVSMPVDNYEPLEYSLNIEPKGQTYSIKKETLTQKRHVADQPFKHIESYYDNIHYFDTNKGKLVPPEWNYVYMETSLSQVPKMYNQPEELRRVLGSVTKYHALDVGRNAPIKVPQKMNLVQSPGNNGEDLTPFLYTLRESDHNRYQTIEDTLKAAFPGFESLNFPPAAAGYLSMTWKEKYFNTPLNADQLSEGTLRFLWLVSLLQSPILPTITMIDEPEVSLHPELLNLFADLLREASQKTQIIVATHSDSFIRFLEPKEVLTMDVDDEGFAQAIWADKLDLDEWLKDYSLDEIWRMGRLGGRA